LFRVRSNRPFCGHPILTHEAQRILTANRQCHYSNVEKEIDSPMKLNIGCGSEARAGWQNLDAHPAVPGVERFDCRDRFPYAENSIVAIYTSHLIEHLDPEDAKRFVHECFRVLRPQGVIRIVTPDFEVLAREYVHHLDGALRGDKECELRHEWLMIEIFDQFSRRRSGGGMLDYWTQRPMPCEDYVIARLGSEVKSFLDRYRGNPGFAEEVDNQRSKPLTERSDQELQWERHRWLYDQLSLRRLLEAAGFHSVRKVTAGSSSIPGFEHEHLDLLPDGSVRKPDSLFVEAVK
jgi:predicted SAM-dependent methyltransferase